MPTESGNKFTRTPKGIRADVKVYFYPDGRGNVTIGKLSRPFTNLEGAQAILAVLIEEGFDEVGVEFPTTKKELQ